MCVMSEQILDCLKRKRDICIKNIIPSQNTAFRWTPALNNRVFLSRNYRLIVAPRKFDVLKTNICPRSEASRANMLVLRTSNFQGATIRPIVPRQKHSIVFIVHHQIFFRALVQKSIRLQLNYFQLFEMKAVKAK